MSEDNSILKQEIFYISRQDWKRLIDYAKAADKKWSSEISGMMVMRQQDDGTYVMSDPTILPQTVSGSRTEIKKEALASYYMENHLESKGNSDLVGDLRFVWWHSHCKMKAFMSTTDEDTMMEGKDDDWTASLVVNVQAEYELRINWFSPAHVYSKIVLYILEDGEVEEELIKEIEEVVERPVVKTYPYSGTPHPLGPDDQGVKRLPPHNMNHYTKPVGQAENEDIGWNPETANEGELVCDFLTQCSVFMDGMIKAYQKGTIPYKELIKEFRDLNVYSEIFGIYILMPQTEKIFKEKLISFDPAHNRSVSSLFFFDELSDYGDIDSAQAGFRGI